MMDIPLEAPSELPKVRDARFDRIRLIDVPMRMVIGLLTLDGQFSYKIEGVPSEYQVLGAKILDDPARLRLAIYHPEFPLNLGHPQVYHPEARRMN